MKLSSDPKPVKFRIVSGGEEHSSLDSLRQNFCISDLQKIETQLIQWLNRQGPEGEEIAKQLYLRDLNSVEDHFAVYKLFFQKEFKDNKIDTPLQLLEYWYGHKKKPQNFDQLIRLRFEKDDAITIFCYRHKISGLTDDWLTTLETIHTKTEEVEAWLKQEKLGAIITAIKRNKIKDISKIKIKQHITDAWNQNYKYVHGDSSCTDDEKAILQLSKVCHDIVHQTSNFVNARQLFCFEPLVSYKGKFTFSRRSDFLFDAKYFVLLLLYKNGHALEIEHEWEKEFFNGLSPKQNGIIMKYYFMSAVRWINAYFLIKKFVLNDLFKFLDLE